MSVWESREALWDFAYRSAHLDALRRRREWFARMAEPFTVLWWLPAGDLPSVDEALGRLGPPAGVRARARRRSRSGEPYDPAGALLAV